MMSVRVAKNHERAAEDAYRVTGLLGILGSLLRAAAGFALANRQPRRSRATGTRRQRREPECHARAAFWPSRA